jgi:hypothetical protein
MNTMVETVANDRPPAATATVSASALAQHLDCSRAYIGKLGAEGVIQRQGDGFPLDIFVALVVIAVAAAPILLA